MRVVISEFGDDAEVPRLRISEVIKSPEMEQNKETGGGRWWWGGRGEAYIQGNLYRTC
jgi:hypothetical protein